VTKIQAITGAIIGSYGTFTDPEGIAFDGVNVWFADHGANDVVEMQASTGTVIGTFSVPDPAGVVFDGTNIWVANPQIGTVTKLLANSGAVVGSYSVGSNCLYLAFDFDANGNSVTKLLASSGAIVGNYPVGNTPYYIAFDGTNVWLLTQAITL
jgi:hypothetical protein